MRFISRVAIALSVFISGVALIPMMGLPTQGFNWQRYAGVYNPAMLEVNHTSGQPGSFFTVFGANFSPDTAMIISANGLVLGQVQTTATGELLFLIDSTGADTGFYTIKASGNETAGTRIILQADAPQWPAENEGTVFALPAGIAQQAIFMPVISK